MTQNPTTDIALAEDAAKPASTKTKRFAQMAGAAALSLGMVGTFGLPAYAVTPDPEGAPDGFTQTQTLKTVNVDAEVLPLSAPDGAVGEDILAEEAAAKAAAEAEKKAAEAQRNANTETNQQNNGQANTQSQQQGADVPAGSGAQGIVSAALAQLGQFQDCTALVERSLRAIGVPAGDLGTQIGEYTALGGTQVTNGAYAPGDILVWSGRHVAVYIGNGQAVHGGYGGNQTVVASAFLDGQPSGVVRFG
ncbi:NlpC/P60 family protein [Leucobacter luti]|uniref:NlpC/P60 family protein n=1 Tax=Leucobacter luti TaxID=340320 RepID=UPI003CFC86EC